MSAFHKTIVSDNGRLCTQRGGVLYGQCHIGWPIRSLNLCWIPVDENDWGLQAFRLPGDKSGDIFVHPRSTFGIASAAYWFGRTIGAAVRCTHRLLGRVHGLLHLIYADDGWLAAVGRDFWRRILMWFFAYELLEIPVTWHKVRGGTEVNWIGYCLNIHTFQKGINQSKRSWIVDWINRKLEAGGVVGRELKSVLGRLSFVAGALRHVRPFLAPIFSWSATMAPGAFSKFPDAVIILLEFIREEVQRRPMRPAEPLERDPVDIFRVDAKAASEDIVVGGWETGRAPDQKKARWFSFRLPRKTAPWAYLRGDPFRNIATLELIGVLMAVMTFSPKADWTRGGAAVTLTALTDNLANTHVLTRYGSSRYPLSIVAMELAVQLDLAGIDLQLQWVPRAQNQPAGDLTNDRFEDFDEQNRLHVDFEKLPFRVMSKLLEKAGELDSELRLFRTFSCWRRRKPLVGSGRRASCGGKIRGEDCGVLRSAKVTVLKLGSTRARLFGALKTAVGGARARADPRSKRWPH